MASKQEMDMEALNVKLDTILDHLGLKVDTSRSARLEAEERGRKAWAPGGERWIEANGGTKAQLEALEAEKDAQEAASKDAIAYEKSEAEKREAMLKAELEQAKADYDALKASVKEEQATLDAQASDEDEPAPKKADSNAGTKK